MSTKDIFLTKYRKRAPRKEEPVKAIAQMKSDKSGEIDALHRLFSYYLTAAVGKDEGDLKTL